MVSSSLALSGIVMAVVTCHFLIPATKLQAATKRLQTFLSLVDLKRFVNLHYG